MERKVLYETFFGMGGEKLFFDKYLQIIETKMTHSLSIARLHTQTFTKYRNKYCGKTVVLIAAGPSVKDFIPIENAIYVGCNRACLLTNIRFDYLFSIDRIGIEMCKKEFFDYPCTKFIGDQNLGKEYQIPFSWSLAGKNEINYYKTNAGRFEDILPVDLTTQPLLNSTSVAIQAMQFILWTNPKKIYLVGIDCTTARREHFINSTRERDVRSRGENPDFNDSQAIIDWGKIKDFAALYYPDTDIISVNPVGLAGMFNEIRTVSK